MDELPSTCLIVVPRIHIGLRYNRVNLNIFILLFIIQNLAYDVLNIVIIYIINNILMVSTGLPICTYAVITALV